jgi:hypothetical protein
MHRRNWSIETMSQAKDKVQEQTTSSGSSSCIAMMGKMFGAEADGMSCESMVARFLDVDEIPAEWSEMMSGMESCCGSSSTE